MLNLNTLYNPLRRQANPGQGGVLSAAVVIMVALVIAGGALSNLSQLNATHSIVTRQNLQTYYAAQAGIQEALASRMIPRSNYMNFSIGTEQDEDGKAFPISQKSFFNRSGRIYKDPANQTGLIAVYRYMVLGGDSARRSDGNYYATADKTPTGVPRLLSTDLFSDQGPFIVISTGTTCTRETTGYSQLVMDKLTNTLNPDCGTGFKAEKTTLVAKVSLQKEGAAKDKIDQVRVYKDNASLPLPAGTYVPGYGWKNQNDTINFEAAWLANQTDLTTNPLLIRKLVFYNFADNTIFKNCTVQTNSTTTDCGAMTNIPPNAAIRVYFNGPVDYRSISPALRLTDRELQKCRKTAADPYQPDDCHVRVVPDPPMSAANHAYQYNTIIPMFPGSTQLILLPPMVALSANRNHEVQIDTTRMRSFNNQKGSVNYKIAFKTQ